MNIRMVLNMLGRTVLCEAALLIFPIIVCIIYGESIIGFVTAVLIAAVLGTVCLLIRPKTKSIYAKEGFVICALSWILLSLIGAVPFVVEKWIPNYIDAFFEIVSGFSTTGATVISNFSSDGTYGLFFWRSLSHFIGGMGVLVFILAIMPLASERSMYLMRAEAPGPTVGKLVPRLKKTAKILYSIYVALTVIEFVLLLCGGMNVYEALIHALATAGTGGFSNRAGSIAEFSPYIQYVIAIFMLIFAINFNLYYYILIKQAKLVIKNEEFRWFLFIVALSVVLIGINLMHTYNDFESIFRHSLFQVSSIISSTGNTTADIFSWPTLSQTVIVILMFIGACAGSTGGGIKVSRIVIIVKTFINELKHMMRPSEVVKVRLDGAVVADEVIHSTIVFFGLYMFIIAGSTVIVAFDGYNFTTSLSAVISCIGNMGPGLWQGSCLAMFSPLSKIVLSFNMLIGRLEIIPILMLFSPSVWRYRR